MAEPTGAPSLPRVGPPAAEPAAARAPGDDPFPGVHVAVVIPCFGVEREVERVVRGIPAWVRTVVAVDDASRDGTLARLRALADPRLVVLAHPVNRGVGGAVQTGFREAVQRGADVVVKLDGDDQMDPARLPDLVGPLVRGAADVTKGNRWADLRALRRMPIARLAGNTALGFLVKLASGYWSVFDPTNGYLALRTDVLPLLRKRLPERYFFESGLLIELGIVRAVVVDVPIPARYGDERSSLSIPRTLIGFPPRLAHGLLRRLFWRYFVYDFTAFSVFVLLGAPMLLFGLGYGLTVWTGLGGRQFASAGQVMISAMPIILGFQLLLQAVVIDVGNTPRHPLGAPLGRPRPDAPRPGAGPAR